MDPPKIEWNRNKDVITAEPPGSKIRIEFIDQENAHVQILDIENKTIIANTTVHYSNNSNITFVNYTLNVMIEACDIASAIYWSWWRGTYSKKNQNRWDYTEDLCSKGSEIAKSFNEPILMKWDTSEKKEELSSEEIDKLLEEGVKTGEKVAKELKSCTVISGKIRKFRVR